MSVNKIDHIGIAVNSLTDANMLYERLLGTRAYKTEVVDSENVITQFFKIGESKIELLESRNANSPIAKFIAKIGEGIHHIAFHVDNIQTEMNRLKEEGFTLIDEKPKLGADNMLVCFIHPKTTNGVLIELCQDI